jgi:hypothetical protein
LKGLSSSRPDDARLHLRVAAMQARLASDLICYAKKRPDSTTDLVGVLPWDLLEKAPRTDPHNPDILNTRAMSDLYSQFMVRKRPKEVIAALVEAASLRPKGDMTDGFLLAMALWKDGKREEAELKLDETIGWMHHNQPENRELATQCTEATSLIRGQAK